MHSCFEMMHWLLTSLPDVLTSFCAGGTLDSNWLGSSFAKRKCQEWVLDIGPLAITDIAISVASVF